MTIINLFLTTTLIFGNLSLNSQPSFVQLNGKRIAMEENGKKYFFHSDHLGSTSVVTDDTGQQVKYLEYKPYGQTKVEEGSKTIKRKFTGKELDDSTGLYDYGARMYEAGLGRFISADTADPSPANPQSLNRYSYCFNNPLKYIDPTGHFADYATYDAFFMAMDLAAYQAEPSFWNAAALGIDAVMYVIPIVPAIGGVTIRGARGISKLADVGRAERTAKVAAQLERAENAKTFSRFMTKSEAKAVKNTGYLRGGREGETFFTTNKYQKARTVKSKLSLEDAPEVRMDFKIKNQPNINEPRIADPKYNETGGGIELFSKDKIKVDIIRKRDLR